MKGAEANQILEGYAAKHADTYTNGIMTGVYSEQEPPADSYICRTIPTWQDWHSIMSPQERV